MEMAQLPRSYPPVDRSRCSKHTMRKPLSLESPPISLFIMLSVYDDLENFVIEIMFDHDSVGPH